MEQMKEMAQKAANDRVRHRPILRECEHIVWLKKGALLRLDCKSGDEQERAVRKRDTPRLVAYHNVAVKKTNPSVNGRRFRRSPKGHTNNRPAAYPACIKVGIRDTVS